ncbi:MAG: DUF4231 domain-containing protein [Chloroflexota bacterium]
MPVVREGVMATAQLVGAAVVDGGTDSGVMALAGQAREELHADIPLVGVAPLGRVTVRGVPAAVGTTALEPRHTHHVLVPGSQWGDESVWLVRVARLLAAGRPVVAVLVDGGPIALSEALECVGEGWPLVALAGSGRSADVVAEYARGASSSRIAADRSALHVSELSAGAEALASTVRRLLEPTGELSQPQAKQSVDYPALYLAASGASRRGQTNLKRLALGEIGFTLAGLVIGGIASQFKPTQLSDFAARITVAVAAIPFLAALILKMIGRSSGLESDWFNGRAVAETVKSMTWRYMMRTPPHDGSDADGRFTADLGGLLRGRADIRQELDRLPARPVQITNQMRATRALDLRARRDFYVTNRLNDQADWYRRKSAASRRQASRWFWVTVMLQLAAASVAVVALAGRFPGLLELMSLLASVSLAGTAWTQLNRYDELAKSYAVAMQELLLISAIAERVETDEALEVVVADGEEAIGRENKLWVAKRGEPT